MTTHHSIDPKRPSQFDYDWALQDKELPFALRARVINAFRKQEWAELTWENVEKPKHVNNQPKPHKKRGRKKKSEGPRTGPGSRHNYVSHTAHKVVERRTSAGKERPSWRVKFQLLTKSFVEHLKGKQHV